LAESRACNAHPCPIDCLTTKWSSWSRCTKTCASGTSSRSRSVVRATTYGGKSCGGVSEKKACQTQACPIDCQMSMFGVWGSCSRSCGSGKKTRSRAVVVATAYGGIACPAALTETLICNSKMCPIDCKMVPKHSWTPCSKSCDGGTTSRTRVVHTKPAFGGKGCPPAIETKECNAQACPVDCMLASWSSWGSCAKNWQGQCKRGKAREIISQPGFGGKPCPAVTEWKACPSWRCEAGACQSMFCVLVKNPKTQETVVRVNHDKHEKRASHKCNRRGKLCHCDCSNKISL